ncbi:DUF4159 domain-containing protein [Methyloligella sp. GL2]|nr:DUF4159 domain-containing protein [Methyloligella sp. GL2]
MTLGSLGFLQPWLLLGLAALPAIWWLLRLTPPSPNRVVFPPTRLLQDLQSTEETPAHSPWWLTLLRMLLAALIIFALAQPVINPDRQGFTGQGPLLLVIDNGWASGTHWDKRREAIATAIDRARRDDRTVILAPTAPGSPIAGPDDPDRARERAAGIMPQPFAPDRKALATRLQKELGGKTGYRVLWLSDGLNYGNGLAFAETLEKIAGDNGKLSIFQPGKADTAMLLGETSGDASILNVRVLSGAEGPVDGTVTALTAKGEPLGTASFAIPSGAHETKATFDLPLEIRNQAAKLEIENSQSAGAVHLLDGNSQWHRVGVISGESREAAQPLLSPLYYVQRALSPYADVVSPREANVRFAVNELIDQNVSVLVLADIGKLLPGTQVALENWLAGGGMLIRFAGPRMEQGGDELLPVILRRGGRSLGGSMSWSNPQPLAAFDETSPFRGLDIPDDVDVKRQVLADPTAATDAQVWARLADGTPLVTALRQGKGWVVLFHVTANSDWSNLPLSGLFVQMLRRLVALAPTKVDVNTGTEATGVEASAEPQEDSGLSETALAPIQTLDGFGQIGPPTPQAAPIAPQDFENLTPSPEHPPGYYGRGQSARALNIGNAKSELVPLANLANVAGSAQLSGYTLRPPLALDVWLYLAALALFAIDMLAMLILSGGMRFRGGARAAHTATALLFAAGLAYASFAPAPAFAQAPPADQQISAAEQFGLKSSLETHLAYVLTGDPAIDETSRQGLAGLTRVLTARTALEPGEPIGVDIDNEELAFFPILYWPVAKDAAPLSDATLAKIDAFMKQGGLIVFDTRDHDSAAGNQFQQSALSRLIGKLDIPPLEPVPANHVLTKSFYLMDSFPGRWDGGNLWVEATQSDDPGSSARSQTDGVSSIVITSNDFASAWALDDRNRPLYPAVPGGEVQREMAFRAGVNIVMYALTGNYKADQVHVPALLERLGQ